MARSTSSSTVYVTSGLRALTDFAWMARRMASSGDRTHATACDEATWLLHQMARTARLNVGTPDRTANYDYNTENGQTTETPSFFTDGAPVDFTPTPERVEELKVLSEAEKAQWMVDVLHPLAFRYAEGRSTYAPSMLNDATRVLRAAGFSLAATEELGMSVWVTDGMGDPFTRLTAAEVAERDSARNNLTSSTSPF